MKDLENQYNLWIETNYPDERSALGQCGAATKKMKESFPQLKRVWGEVQTIQGFYDHWWLECPQLQKVIDPTAKQFTYIMGYEAYPSDDPRSQFPRRKCMNCGADYYREEFCCSDECLADFAASTE